MSRFRRFDLIECTPSPSVFLKECSLFNPKTLLLQDDFETTLDLLCPKPTSALLDFDDFDTITDLIQIERTPFYTSSRRVQLRVGLGTELQSLSDRVSALEKQLKKKKKEEEKVGERKYTWTAEIKSPEKDGVDRKYKWIAEVKDGKKKGGLDKSYKFTAEIKGKGEDSRTYSFKASNASEGEESEKKEKKIKEKKCGSSKSVGNNARVVEIEEPADDHGAIVLRQVFAKRVEKRRGKRKELSPQDAALAIQMSFRAYLIRRSQALRGLRELAIAKTKLKELRGLFNNFTYRRRVARDAEERQRFSEKIIVPEVPDHTVPGLSGEQARPVRKVLRPLNPEAALQKSQIDEQENESSIVFFRLKRTAEYEPSDILALDGMNMPLISKKHQAKHIRDLENEINKLDINKEKEVNEEMKENENNKEKNLLEGLLFSEDSQMDMKFVLKRIDPQNIYDLEKDEEAFRKNYKTMYNDINSKQKRDNILNQRRKNLLENPTNENGDNNKDAKKIKIYDINLKEEFKQNVLFCNNSPMVVTNLLEIAKKEKLEEEVDDNNYAYYAFRKVPKKMATGAQEVRVHDSAKGVFSSHLAEEAQDYVHEGQDKDSDYEYKNDVDNRDSNAESNSEFEYPDEEEVEGSHSRDPWSDSEKQRNNNYYDEDDEFDQNNEDSDEEEDEDIMFKDKKYHEEKFTSNFWSKVKDMSKEDME